MKLCLRSMTGRHPLGRAHVSEQPSFSEEVTDGMSSGGSGLRLSGWFIVLYTSMRRFGHCMIVRGTHGVIREITL
jgi:hypothetical protein